MKKLKKLISLLIITTLIISVSACKSNDKTIIVGASPSPHFEILNFIKDDIEKAGYKLEIKLYNDYMMPNKALSNGDIDANFFQHEPYLKEYCRKNKVDLVAVAAIHYEPMAIFGNSITSVGDLKSGDLVILPTDTSNLARALFLLDANGIIELSENADIATANESDIKDSKGLEIKRVNAETIPSQLKNSNRAAIGVINGNYALNAKLNLSSALAIEDKESETAKLYANVIAVKKGNENNPKIKLLVDTLKTEKVKQFISNNFNGAVLPSD